VKRKAKPIEPGARFGRWTVVEPDRDRSKPGLRFWVTSCECGNRGSVNAADLRRGKSTQCKVCSRRSVTTHGMTRKPEYRAWMAMQVRCEWPHYACYKNYGGRGIRVCARWRRSFEAFFEDMGPRPSPEHSLDRIDNNKGYSKANCRWATREQQQNNRRNNRFVTHRGETKSMAQWARSLGIPKSTAFNRLERNAPITGDAGKERR